MFPFGKRGASLVEVTVTSGLLTIIAIGVASTMNSLINEQYVKNQRLEAMAFVSTLQLQLENERFCSCNFSGTYFDPTTSAPTMWDGGALASDCSDSPEILARIGETIPDSKSGTTLNQIQLIDFLELSETLYSAQIELEFGSEKSQEITSRHRLPIILIANSSILGNEKEIKSCGRPKGEKKH